MRFRLSVPLACVAGALIAATGGPLELAAQPANTGARASVALFDGTSTAGWRGYKQPQPGGRWVVQDGTLSLPADPGRDTRGARDIITVDTFDLFDLSWEWKVALGGNSGLKYFVLEDQNSAIGHEYQLIDDERHPDAKIGPHRQTAAFYDVLAAPQPRPLKAAGEWNSSRITVMPSRTIPGGGRVSHYLNGTLVLEYELDSPELRTAVAKSKFKGIERFGKLQKGHILLQDHGDPVSFRNIRVQRLGSS